MTSDKCGKCGGGCGYPRYVSEDAPVPDGNGGFRWPAPLSIDEDDPVCPGEGFETALVWLKSGYRTARASWNGISVVCLGYRDRDEDVRRRRFYTVGADGEELHAWMPDIDDILAEDWVLE